MTVGKPQHCASCTWPDAFPTSHADWCAIGRVLALLGPAEDDWRWDDQNLRTAIRSTIADARAARNAEVHP